jgi:hypothetical protein
MAIFTSCATQGVINETILDNFRKHHGDIYEILNYFSGDSPYMDNTGYSGNYADEMCIYIYELSSNYNGWEMRRNIISDESFNYIDHIIKLYKKTMSLKVPSIYKELYNNSGLGKNGHENYIRIISIVCFANLEYMFNNFSDEFPQEKHETIRKSIIEFKKLFSKSDWDITVKYFRTR